MTAGEDPAAYVAALDEDPDPAHLDITPAVRALGRIGERALPALLAPLSADAEMTRLHAQRALEAIIDARHGFRAGQGFPTPEDERSAAEEVRGIGYAYDADPASREAAIERLRGRIG